VTLGIIPLGTFNYFAREHAIPTELDAAIQIIKQGHTKEVAVGLVQDRVFLNNASFGLYTKLIRQREDPLHMRDHALIIEYGTELILIISLLTCGISLDRPFTLSHWRTPIRLLGIAMPLTIIVIGYLAAALLDLSLPEACLIAACLAPTDPVLAREVQVNAPNEGGESEERFGLTSEAGLNDGLAFPFVHLALGIAAYGITGDQLIHWLSYDVAYRIGAGVLIGIIVGRGIAHYVFKEVEDHTNPDGDEGLIVMAAIFLSYGLAELANGYGFLAVFCAAVAGRQQEKKHRYHKKPYHFAKQVEDLLLGLLLLGLGGLAIVLWENVFHWKSMLFALVVILVVRPACAYISLMRSEASRSERRIISFFGIRGMGSIYYLAYAHNILPGGVAPALWGAVICTIILSVIIHGSAAGLLMNKFSKANTEAAKL